MFTDGRLRIVEMPILPKMTHGLMAIPLRIPPGFFAEVDKWLRNSYGRSRDPGQRNKLEKRAKLEDPIWFTRFGPARLRGRTRVSSSPVKAAGLTLPNFKSCCKATVTKTVGCWHKDRRTDRWNRKENPEISPRVYRQLVFDTGAESVQWGKDGLFSKWCERSQAPASLRPQKLTRMDQKSRCKS